MDFNSDNVKIHLYDLSQGMAKSFGRMLLGKDIEGIWHTGIEVYGKEFYYGGGICQGKPKQTPYGSPIKEIVIGTTEVPEQLFLEFLAELSPKFTMEKYDLFSNNCNNFTNECCEFLTGKPIPEYIIGLPKEVLSTPLGKMIKPMMDQMQNKLMQNSSPMYLPQYFEGQSEQQRTPLPNLSLGNTANRDMGAYSILEPNDLFVFNNLLNTEKAMIVDFFSFTCPPCMQIKPIFEALAKDYKTKGSELKFVKVNTATARDISTKYGISSIPTFIGFYEGKVVEKFSGANRQKLESLIFTLEKRINESLHKSQEANLNEELSTLNASFNIFNPNKKDPFIFLPDNFDIPIKKILQITENDVKLSPEKSIFVNFSKNPKSNLKSFSNEDKANLMTWLVESLFYLGISETTIPFIDMIRLLTSDQGFGEALIMKSPERIEWLFDYFNRKDEEVLNMPRGLRMIILRTLTNIASHKKSIDIFSRNIVLCLKQLLKITKILKDDRASNYACLMLLYNLILLLEQNIEYKSLKKEIAMLMVELLKNENEEKNLLAIEVNLLWVIHDDKVVKSIVNEVIDRLKLLRLEGSENSNLRLITKDLIMVIENKL